MTVAILMGSRSDLDTMKKAAGILKEFNVAYELKVLSAHRAAESVREYVQTASARGIRLFICGAGMAAHLAGAVAGQTTLPVIGVPLSGSALAGQDALLSTVQMPKGVPVATVAIDGAYNAGILALQMLALADPTLAARLEEFRRKMTEEVLQANTGLE
jgi:5-(carboxyamino)imidazole ribonucleotide mutase